MLRKQTTKENSQQ